MMDLAKFKPSEEFLKGEEICGYSVSRKIKAVWAVELDILLAFKEVCERNSLRFWMFGGSLLGTIRHKGFIPWDEDIDVIMPRRDYDRLMEIASKEFSAPYAFENPETLEGQQYFTHCKLRNSECAWMIEALDVTDKGRGPWIDIFALDDTVTCLAPLHYFIARVARLIFRILNVSKVFRFRLWNRHERIFSKFKCNGYMQGMRPTAYRIYSGRHYWEGTVEREFCGIKVPVPEHYEDILSLCYGDWKQFKVKEGHFKTV